MALERLVIAFCRSLFFICEKLIVIKEAKPESQLPVQRCQERRIEIVGGATTQCYAQGLELTSC